MKTSVALSSNLKSSVTCDSFSEKYIGVEIANLVYLGQISARYFALLTRKPLLFPAQNNSKMN